MSSKNKRKKIISSVCVLVTGLVLGTFLTRENQISQLDLRKNIATEKTKPTKRSQGEVGCRKDQENCSRTDSAVKSESCIKVGSGEVGDCVRVGSGTSVERFK